jgi:hypothetical protein
MLHAQELLEAYLFARVAAGNGAEGVHEQLLLEKVRVLAAVGT